MKYKCVIVDDEGLARGLIENHLSQLDDFELVASCESAIEASKVLKNEKIDLLFLDIEMPVLKGTDFFKNLINRPKVIFITAYRDFALEGFELNAVDYLLKPISFARFFKAIEKFVAQKQVGVKVYEKIKEVENNFIFVRKDRKQVKVFYDEILYVESVKDYIKIITENEIHVVKYSLTNFLEILDQRFIRTHRSYIINMDKITAYTKHDIEIGVLEIPIGESYKILIEQKLN
ncbi:LytTR family DNA-binding domain-containing protein [Aquimarina addita]|uniref:LytTR family DNA-binding domain-containing protein n=1 Tax=Aquimarina addita TaxID=870485 RepID=A0ABP7XFI0_9FLAO